MRSFLHRFVIGRRRALAVLVYVGVVIALLAMSFFLIADLRDKAAGLAAIHMRLAHLSERSQQGLSASIGSNPDGNGSRF